MKKALIKGFFLIFIFMMEGFIKKILKESLNEMANNDIWYHGTPDVRGLEKEGGFSDRSLTIDYISDLGQYSEIQKKLKIARESGNEDEYWKYLDMVPKLKKKYELRKPIFLTNDVTIARTYADPKRSFDYQNSVEKVVKVSVQPGKVVKIVATGDRFRFIDVSKVKRGFVNAGISEAEFDEVLNKFTFYQKNKKGIKTDTIAVIGEWFGFDYIDVIGVLDAYEGGSKQSTVRMVYDPNSIKIIK